VEECQGKNEIAVKASLLKTPVVIQLEQIDSAISLRFIETTEFRFPDLPAELREYIYAYVMCTGLEVCVQGIEPGDG